MILIAVVTQVIPDSFSNVDYQILANIDGIISIDMQTSNHRFPQMQNCIVMDFVWEWEAITRTP